MPRLRAAAALSLAGAFFCGGSARAQFGRGAPEWMADGGDAQRSQWIRSDPKISVQSLSKPGFEMVWKIKLAHEPGPAATLDRYIGYRGFRSLALMASPSGDLTGIDTDLGRIEWKRNLPVSAARGSAVCSAGMEAEAVRPTNAAYPGAPAGRGGGGMFGRSGPAKSGVGEAGEGAVTIAEIAARAAAANPTAGRGGRAPGAPGMPGGPEFRRMPTLLDVLASDGMLHSMYISNGEEPAAPTPFLPADAKAHGLIVVNNVAYAATTDGCAGAPNGVWALDLASKQVVHWETASGVAGQAGFAFGPDGTVYAATNSGELVALDPKTLEVKATYRADGQSFASSPLVFEHQTKSWVAAAGKDGRVHLVDAASLTGAAYPAAASGDLASWQDGGGTRWIAAPSKDAIAAWKVADQEGSPALQPGWTSREMASPMTPVVINGVVFAVSNASSPVLYAFDGSSGRELWNSGKTMSAQIRHGVLSGSDTRLYLGTSDGTFYAFGFPIEH
ncbi:MAG TPA: PQQ-binding-like beta-propeller repeat protein [Bryobacteraceae bacterium]|nr:PQQ-binding-like beta-propeller repeat protein [Bryobacteraceae bacterium]